MERIQTHRILQQLLYIRNKPHILFNGHSKVTRPIPLLDTLLIRQRFKDGWLGRSTGKQEKNKRLPNVGFHKANLNSASQTWNASLSAPLSLRAGPKQFPMGSTLSPTAVSKTRGLSQEVISSQLMASPLVCAGLWPQGLPNSLT